MAKQTKKVVKYRKPLNLNLGIIIFTMMFIYIIVCIFLYFTKSHITTYDFKFDMEGTVLKLANYQVLSNLNILEQNNISELVDFCYAPKSGILVYSTDGYENLTMDLVTPEIFSKENYEKKMTHSYDLVGQGDPVYKLITDENWSIILPIEEERALL